MRKTSTIRVLLVLGFAGGLFVAYTQGPQPAKLDLVKVKDDLFVIHNALAPGNVAWTAPWSNCANTLPNAAI